MSRAFGYTCWAVATEHWAARLTGVSEIDAMFPVGIGAGAAVGLVCSQVGAFVSLLGNVRGLTRPRAAPKQRPLDKQASSSRQQGPPDKEHGA